MSRIIIRSILLASLMAGTAQAKVSPEEAARLGVSLTPVGAEKAGNAAGTIPAWDGGYVTERPPAGKERDPNSYPLLMQDKPLYTVTAANMAQYRNLLTAGHQALLKRFPDTYKMNVYTTRRTASVPDFIAEATKLNAVNAELANGGESLVNAITGVPFPIPGNALEIMWNHKTRYRSLGVTRYNTQLAVQTNGDFQPYKLREDVRFHYNAPNQQPADLGNIIIYFLQITTSPPRQSGNVLLVHETMDQIKEARRAWLYNPGQRRVRRAPNVAYDNPGTGADGLRTNDQLDAFNGATDRYTWKLVGKKEMLVPYNAGLLGDNSLKYGDIAKKSHLNQDLARYELRRVWIIESQLKPGTSHIYSRRTFYVEEDAWSIASVDIYDRRKQLWRVQEAHTTNVPWAQINASTCGTVYDLQGERYLLMDLSNEEPLFQFKDFPLSHFEPSNIAKMATK